MKKILAAAVLVVVFSVPALAQSRGGSGAPVYSGGGAGGGLGGSLGGSTGSRLPTYPVATFSTAAASGADATFAPSTFLAFDKAVAEGNAAVAAVHKSVAEVAAENSATARAKAKFEFVQDAYGRVVPANQK